jgi:transposase
LVNAKQARNIPGRKSDVSDAAWLAGLAAHGLLRASFVPPEQVRQLRDLTRTRKHLSQERSREYLRIDKGLQDAGIKLSSVASKMTTQSVRRILEALAAGERDPRALTALVDPQMRKKEPQLIEALTGRFTHHHAFMVRLHLDRIDELDAHLARIDARIDALIEPFRPARDALTTIPGISTTVANGIIGEIGIDMGVFDTAGHLASWAGVCPGQNESAGRVKSGKTRPGNRYLQAQLGIAVLAIARSKSTYLGSRYRRLATRIGRKKAIVATEHTLLVIVWNMLRDGVAYRELGPDYYQRRINPDRARDRALHQLHTLGYEVTLAPSTAA